MIKYYNFHYYFKVYISARVITLIYISVFDLKHTYLI